MRVFDGVESPVVDSPRQVCGLGELLLIRYLEAKPLFFHRICPTSRWHPLSADKDRRPVPYPA